MQRKSRGLFYITLFLLISSFNIFSSAPAANNNKKATEPKLCSAEAAAAWGFVSTPEIFPHPEESLKRLALARANSNSSAAASDAAGANANSPAAGNYGAASDSDADGEDDELAPLSRSQALIQKKSIASKVRKAIRAGSPLSEVLSSEKAYAAFYLESPRSAPNVNTSGKNKSFKKEKEENAGNRKSKSLLTPAQVAHEEQRLKDLAKTACVHKDMQHKEQELAEHKLHLKRLEAELALLRKQAEADAAAKAKADLMSANSEIAVRA